MSAAAPPPVLLGRVLLRSLRWLPERPDIMRTVPTHWQAWLFDPGSLTERLRATFGADTFQVRVLATRSELPTRDEAQLLNLPPRQACWTREVVLSARNRPRVLARTLIPQRAFHGPAQQLKLLGNRPLGAALFRCPNLIRHPMQFAHIHTLAGQGEGWARRSVFDYFGCPVLVSEFFMATCVDGQAPHIPAGA